MNEIMQINSVLVPIATISSIEDLCSKLDKDKEYQVVAYLIPAIVFGTYYNGFRLSVDTLDFDQIDSIRIFCADSELYCYRHTDPTTGKASASLKGRLRLDGNPTDGATLSYYHDASQILIGSRIAEKMESYTLVTEDRGFQLLLPSEWITSDPAKTRIRVLTRNYLAEWDNGQLSYDDHRFIAISNQDKES